MRFCRRYDLWISAAAGAVLLGCLPDFPPFDCSVDDDCVVGELCVDQLCRPPGGGRPPDGGEPFDSGGLDVGPDGSVGDGGGGPGDDDGGTPDQGIGGVNARLDPATLDFGPQPVGCQSPSREILVENLGSTSLAIQDVRLTSTPTSSFEVGAVPTSVEAQSSAPIAVRLAPRVLGQATGTLEVEIQGGTVLEAALSGLGSMDREIVQELRVPTDVDVVYVVDNGSNAGPTQQALASVAPDVLDALTGVDYRLGVVTTATSAGNEIGTLVAPGTADGAAVLANQFAVGTGGTNAPQTQSLRGAQLAVEASASRLRANTGLFVVIVSERPDDPSSPQTPGVYVRAMAASNGSAPFALNAVTPTDGCTLPSGGTGSVDPRIAASVISTSGVSSDICEPPADWLPALTGPPDGLVPTTRAFALDNPPEDEDEIEVELNGREVAARNWNYQASMQRIEFEDSFDLPGGGRLQITYDASCDVP